MEGHRSFRSRKSRISIRQIHEDSFPAKRRRRLPPLHLYLEEQKENAGEAKTVGVQADKFAPRRKKKEYVPPKRGFDCGTQVEHKYTFNFDLNVKPLVEVVVQKTLEQALMETQQEEVQKALGRVQNEFRHKEERRKQELQERIEKEQKIVKEKQDRKRQAIERQKLMKIEFENAAKAEAGEAPKREPVPKNLNDDEFLTISNQIIPDICKGVANRLQISKIAEQLAQKVLRCAIERHSANIQHARNELQNFRIRLQIFGEAEEIGPIVLARDATIGDLAEAVSKWYDSTLSLEEIKLYCGKELLEFNVPVKTVAKSSICVKIEKTEEQVENETDEVEQVELETAETS